MHITHTINTHFSHRLKCCVAVAHDGLANVIQAMIAMEYYFVCGHVGHAGWVVGEAEEVL